MTWSELFGLCNSIYCIFIKNKLETDYLIFCGSLTIKLKEW